MSADVEVRALLPPAGDGAALAGGVVLLTAARLGIGVVVDGGAGAGMVAPGASDGLCEDAASALCLLQSPAAPTWSGRWVGSAADAQLRG